MTLRAVVIGAGWAGEGHTPRPGAAGVDVVALCGRSPEPTVQRTRLSLVLPMCAWIGGRHWTNCSLIL